MKYKGFLALPVIQSRRRAANILRTTHTHRPGPPLRVEFRPIPRRFAKQLILLFVTIIDPLFLAFKLDYWRELMELEFNRSELASCSRSTGDQRRKNTCWKGAIPDKMGLPEIHVQNGRFILPALLSRVVKCQLRFWRRRMNWSENWKKTNDPLNGQKRNPCKATKILFPYWSGHSLEIWRERNWGGK